MSIRRNASGDSPLEATPFAGNDAKTITYWMKREGNGGTWDCPLSVDDDSTNSYIYVERNGSNTDWNLYVEGGSDASILDQPPTVGEWYFVAITVTADFDVTAYWKQDGDAGLSAAITINDGADKDQDHLMLFDSPWGGEWFNGSLSSVKAWDTVLTLTQIETEMDEQAAQKTTDLIGEWHLTDTATMTTDSSGNGNTLTGGTGLSTDTDEPADLNTGAGATPFIGWGIPAGIT